MGAQGVDDEDVRLLADLERAKELLLLNGPRASLCRVGEDVFRLGLETGHLVPDNS